MRKYNGKWIDCFNISVCTDNDRPNCKGKILLETPNCDYLMSREQWNMFKKKVNDFEL